jgi:hypothetical protein
MKLVGRIPVEPLDDERMTNIERRIVAGASDAAAARPIRESRLHLVLGFAIIAVVVMCAGLVGYRMRGGEPTPTLAVTAPLQVHTDVEHSTLDIGDAKIESSPSTAFTVTRPDGGVLVAMTRGKVELQVGKRGDRAPLVVRAGDTDVIVVGTRFSVDYGDGTGEVEVRVTEGVVKVAHHQKEVRVAAGSAWRTERGLVALADIGPGLTKLTPPPGATIGDPAHKSSGSVEIDMSNAPDVLHNRVAQVPDARLPTAGSNSETVRTMTPGRPENVRPRTLAHPNDPKGDIRKLIGAQPVLPALDVGEADASKAMKKYQTIMTNEKGKTEAYAFYSMAVVQALKLDRPDDALSTLDAFERRARAQKSEYLLPALWLRVRIRCLQKNIEDSCRQAAEAYERQLGHDGKPIEEDPPGLVAHRITMPQ